MDLLMAAASQHSHFHFQDDASLIVLKATGQQVSSRGTGGSAGSICARHQSVRYSAFRQVIGSAVVARRAKEGSPA